MHRPSRCAIAVAPALAAALAVSAAAQEIRVVTYNIAQLNGNNGAMEAVLTALNDDDKPGFAVAPHAYVFQEVDSNDHETLEDMLNDLAPAGVTYTTGTYTNSGEQPGAQALIYRSDVLFEVSGEHADIFTQATRYADRWRVQLLEDPTSPEAGFYIYSAHLKASSGQENEDLRELGAVAIRADADTLPADAQIIYAGDMNFYHNEEDGYEAFLAPGPGQALDPLGSGSWSGGSNAIKHSQSPREEGNGSLIGGGVDDRFDFLLVSHELLDDIGFRMIPGTYRSLGNDGQHFNDAINLGNNFYYPDDVPRSNALADALHEASDHLPVVLELMMLDPPPPPECEGDVTNDDSVDVEDLVFVVLSWGPCNCNADLDGSGVVDVTDLITVILNWGPCK